MQRADEAVAATSSAVGVSMCEVQFRHQPCVARALPNGRVVLTHMERSNISGSRIYDAGLYDKFGRTSLTRTKVSAVFIALFSFLLSRYPTQMPGTATVWNRCGDATADGGYAESLALNSGCVNALRKAAVDSQTA